VAQKIHSVSRILFHCSRALGQSIDRDGAVPMSPGGFRYAQGTVVYVPPEATQSQLYVAPELAREGVARDARSTCYEAAMCLRAHVEGAERLERKLLGVAPEGDVEPAWEAWLGAPDRPVPAPPTEAYGGLGKAVSLLDSWTRRNPDERSVPEEGWHALTKAVLESDPHATAPPTPPGERREWPTWLVRSGLLVVAGVLLGVLLWMVLGGEGGDAAARDTIDAATRTAWVAANPMTVQLGEHSFSSTLRHDRFTVPADVLDEKYLTVRIDTKAAPDSVGVDSVGVWPDVYWGAQDARAAAGLPGPAVLQSSEQGGWTPIAHAETTYGILRLADAGLIPLDLTRPALAWLHEEKGGPAYCLASDLNLPHRPRLLVRLVIGERTLDLTVDADGRRRVREEEAAATAEKERKRREREEADQRQEADRRRREDEEAKRREQEKRDAERHAREKAERRAADARERERKARAADPAGHVPGPAAPDRKVMSGWMKAHAVGLWFEARVVGAEDPIAPSDALGETETQWPTHTSTLEPKDVADRRIQLRIALPDDLAPGTKREIVLWPRSAWELEGPVPEGFSVPEPVSRAAKIRLLRREAGWPHWMPAGEMGAWKVEATAAEMGAGLRSIVFQWAAKDLGNVSRWLLDGSGPTPLLRADEPGDPGPARLLLARVQAAEKRGHFDLVVPVSAPVDGTERRRQANPSIEFSLEDDSAGRNPVQRAASGARHIAIESAKLAHARWLQLTLKYKSALTDGGPNVPVFYPARNVPSTTPTGAASFPEDRFPGLPALLTPNRLLKGMRASKTRDPRTVSVRFDLDEIRKKEGRVIWRASDGSGTERILITRVRVPREPYFIDLTASEAALGQEPAPAEEPETPTATLPGDTRVSFRIADWNGSNPRLLDMTNRVGFVTPSALHGKLLQIVVTPRGGSSTDSIRIWPSEAWKTTVRALPKQPAVAPARYVYQELSQGGHWQAVRAVTYGGWPLRGGEVIFRRPTQLSGVTNGIEQWLRSDGRVPIYVVSTRVPVGPFNPSTMHALLAWVVTPENRVFELRLRSARR
jgi:hypothetical protein